MNTVCQVLYSNNFYTYHMKVLINWDNKTWLSSKSYINSFNLFLLKKKKYLEEQEYAKANNLGLWDMKFEFPWNFRKNN